jgi:Domain of unknown function (DUF5668)/B-box zinc finger
MNCAVHADQAATGYCRNCGKPLCPQCTREVRGAMYCEDCLAGILTAPQTPGASVNIVPRDSRPGTALALGFIPGLGAVYNAEYLKAFIHLLIFGGMIALLSADIPDGLRALFGISLGCFYFYMPIEAYRVAKARSEGSAEPALLISERNQKPIGALVLIGIGTLLLLANFGWLDSDWFAKSWPAALIILGAYFLYDRVKKKA